MSLGGIQLFLQVAVSKRKLKLSILEVAVLESQIRGSGGEFGARSKMP